MISSRLDLMRRAARVQRLHTIPTPYRQSVGEHTFGVLAVLFEITTPSAELLTTALFHDVTEAALGDIPATTKWASEVLETALKGLEEDCKQTHSIPTSSLSDEERSLLKFADFVELAMFCLEEAPANKRLLVVVENCLKAIERRGLHHCNDKTEYLYIHLRGELSGIYNE